MRCIPSGWGVALGVLLMLVTFATLLVSFRIAGGNMIPRQRD